MSVTPLIATMTRPCPECGRAIRPSMLARHITAAHTRELLSAGMMTTAEFDRFVEKIEQDPEGCWRWTGGLDEDGYGFCHLGYPSRSRRAHLVAYEHFIGLIPEGLTLDHLCRNRPCVNPTHTEPISLATNVMRGEGRAVFNAAKTRCVKGHSLDEENTGYSRASKKRGGVTLHRFCKICAREAKRLSALRRRGMA